MKKEMCILAALVLIFAIPAVLASTEINVRTLPNHKVHIILQSITPPVSTILEGSFIVMSDGSGMAKATYSGEKKEARINVKVSKDGKEVVHYIFEDMGLGSPLYLQINPNDILDDYKKVEEEKAAAEAKELADEESAKLAEEQAELKRIADEETARLAAEKANSSIFRVTGSAISGTLGKTPKYIYYILGIGLIAFIFVFLARSGKIKGILPAFQSSSKIIPKTNPIVPKTQPAQTQITSSTQNPSEVIANAERKIKEAQMEIAKLKNQERITDAEKKLKEDVTNLEKLKRGY